MSPESILIWYKIARVGVMALALYGIIYYLYFTKKGKTMEEPAHRMLEEQD